MKKRSKPSTFECPHCGGSVKSNALACPHCGSDRETGWSDDYDPSYEDDEFDYDEYLENEFPQHADPFRARKDGKSWVRVVAIILLIMMVLSLAAIF